jgi:hypothetical protein
MNESLFFLPEIWLAVLAYLDEPSLLMMYFSYKFANVIIKKNILLSQKLANTHDADVYEFASFPNSYRRGSEKVTWWSDHGRGPKIKILSQAVKYDYKSLVSYLAHLWPITMAHDNRLLVPIAIKSSHLDMAKWLVDEKHCIIDYNRNSACSVAARNGDVATLEWLYENNCPLDLDIYHHAASNGQVCVFQWLKVNSIPFTDITVRLAFGGASYHGHTEVLQWILDNGISLVDHFNSYSFHTCSLKTLKWFKRMGYLTQQLVINNNNDYCAFQACNTAAKYGKLDIIKWLRKNGFVWNVHTSEYAASSGDLETLKWILENGCPYDWTTCAGAASSGNIEILQWATAYGCPWNNSVMATHAAKGGNIDLLKWIRNTMKCLDWSTVTSTEALGDQKSVLPEKNVAMFKWLIVNGCPIDHDKCMSVLYRRKCYYTHPDLIQWIKDLAL